VPIIREIPLFPEVPRYDLRVVLDGRAYVLDVDWNGTDGRWYLAIRDSAGALLSGSRKVVCNVPLFRSRLSDPRLPRKGYLIALTLDSRESNDPPGWADLGRRVRLFERVLE